MQRTTVILVIIALALGLSACRKTWSTKLGFPSEVYEQNDFVVHEDDRLANSYLIVPRATSTERFAVIGDHVYALEEADSRAYLARGITPGAALEAGKLASEPVFFETLAEAVGATGNYGITTDSGIDWVGKAPGGPATVAVIDPSLIERDAIDIVSAVGSYDGTPTWFGAAPDAGQLVIVEGSALTSNPVVARLGREATAVKPSWATNVEGPLPPADKYLYASRVGPIARRAGAEFYVTIWFERVYIGSTEPIQSRGLPFLLGSNPLGVGGTAEEVATELRGLDSILRGKPLAAVGFFDIDDFDIQGNPRAARLGMQELLASAGYLNHVRRLMLRDGPETGIRRGIYARMLFRAGDKEARAVAAKAYEELLESTLVEAAQASGDVAMLVARIDASNGNWKTASAVASQAAQNYQTSRDAIRAAEAELFAGEAAIMAGQNEEGEELVNRARSRFYHGKSPYLSALSEINLAYLYARIGNTEEATNMADYARRRFVASGDDAAANRASIALARVKADVASVRKGLQTALERGDSIGALDAATIIVHRDGVPDGEERLTLAVAIAHGFPFVTEPLRRVSAASAAEKICVTRGDWIASIKPSEAELVSQMCGSSVDLAAISKAPPVNSSALYKKLLRGEYTNIRQLVGEFGDRDKLDFETLATLAMARYLVEGETAESSHGMASEAARALDAKSRWSTLNAQADRAERAGAHALATMWGAEAIDAVKAADLDSPTSTRAEVARQHVARLMRMGRPLDANDAASKALIGMAATQPAEKRAAAVLAGYGAVAASTAGADADVKELTGTMKTMLEGVPPGELAEAQTTLAWYAASHGESQLAARWARSARSSMKGLTSAERSATMVARLAVVDAQESLDKGNANAAFKAVAFWFDNPGDDPDVASDLWEIALDTAPSAEMRDGLITRLGGAAPELEPAALGVRARLLLDAGDAAGARKILDASDDVGATPSAALTLDLRSRALSEPAAVGKQIERLAQTTPFVFIGLLNATQFADDPRAAALEWAKRRAAMRGTPAATKRRLDHLVELATVRPVSPPKTRGLQDDVETALGTRDPAVIVPTVVERVEDLIETGRVDAAITVLERTASWFAKTDPESTAELARLRLAAKVIDLKPIDAYAASNEALAGATNARLRLLVARNDLLLGLDRRAADQLRLAAESARSSKDRSLIKEIEALAGRFDITL